MINKTAYAAVRKNEIHEFILDSEIGLNPFLVDDAIKQGSKYTKVFNIANPVVRIVKVSITELEE